ncbi:spermatogenesis-associated protein 6 [Callorhinchus milii]|uniref:spermatogenesis-associated protein 6 n=1 Tax=Callorhinchus milii TaxID=7868 RepID=UPI001C3FC797|nr:spermatogenesis-associated protein 6 [Callorhinchus milii]
MSRKALRCTVRLDVQAVTCPGVFLPEKDDVYLSVCIMGKFHKTKFLPSIFPLNFNGKMKFEKIFPEAMNPAHLADLLELDTTKFELIQLTPPAGETLAVHEENTRDFLYPGPRLTPTYTGSDRELLMKRSINFPGIAPRLEFSTTSIIKECPLNQIEIEDEKQDITLESQVSPLRKSTTEMSKRKPFLAGGCTSKYNKEIKYKQPTAASQLRSPSPYTRRRMAELSEDAKQRLGHLNLGPFEFKTEIDNKPPFVVRHVCISLHQNHIGELILTLTHCLALGNCFLLLLANTSSLFNNHRNEDFFVWSYFCGMCKNLQFIYLFQVNHKVSPKDDLHVFSSSFSCKPSVQNSWSPGSRLYDDPSLRGSYRPKRSSLKVMKPPPGKGLRDGCFDDSDEYIMSQTAGRLVPSSRSRMVHSAPSSIQKQSSLLNTSSLRERFYSDRSTPTKWEEIHQRVKKILETHSARKRLSFADFSIKHDHPDRRSALYEDSLCDSAGYSSPILQRETSVHLGNGDYWSNRAAMYKGKPHRAVFEDSLEKIYRNLYRKAASTT